MKRQDVGIFNYNIAKIYSDTGKEPINPNFFVLNLEEISVPLTFRVPSRSDHFGFILVKEGSANIKINLIEHHLSASSFFIISPSVVHEFLDRSENAAITIMAFSDKFLSGSGVAGKHVDAFTFLASQNNPPVKLSSEDLDVLLSLMTILKKRNLASGEHPFMQDVLQHGFNMFMMELAVIFQRQQSFAKINLTRKEDLLMSFIKLVTQFFKAERSVQFYADALFITPKHLTKTIKEVTGRTCGDLIDEMVITEAKMLLKDLSFSVGNVADELHFSDQFFFSKFFKQHTGSSPSEYRATN